ncbi:protein SCAI [Phycomyces nitens]|nr:protein SCAI [Phycomyces nitens]
MPTNQSNPPSTTTTSATPAAPAAPAAPSTATAAVVADEDAIRQQKLVEEFQYLLEKSQSLFSGLRDLPPTGNHRQWRPYFEKTFEVYTKLWRFQQAHRPILENKNNYGLKRWEVGEIASKIGQLYYHYYLRTSETNYLHEAYVFYEAVHERQYFKDILEVKNPALMIKKLRYYARFIVVCLLLNKDETIRMLTSELEGLVEEYTKSFKPPDAKEWQLVLDEITTFMEAEKKLVPIRGDRTPVAIIHRLLPSPREKETGRQRLKLQEAILVGNYQKQIKFSELTLDMYRMLQSLERQPGLGPSAARTSSGQPNQLSVPSEKAIKRTNPHKYLLYRPPLSQLIVYIATAYKDVGENSALLLYLSADGCAYPEVRMPLYSGGVTTAQRKANSDRVDTAPSIHCLNPADLLPFTRKPLFLIVDSDNSVAFKAMPNLFDQPVMCLLSPIEYPSSVQDKSEIGSLFTLFLHTPLLGFCSISDIGNLDQDKWDQCVAIVTSMERKIGESLIAETNLDPFIKRFMSDEFLWTFIVRFVLCSIILRCHSSFKDDKSFPTSSPALPESIYVSPEILLMFHGLTMEADVRTYFTLPISTPPPPPTEV